MKKPEVTVDWTIAEDDRAWQANPSAPAASPKSPERASLAVSRNELMLAVLISALLLLLVSGWVWRHQGPAARTANDLHSALVQEVQTQTHLEQSLDDEVQVENYERLGDRVMAHVIVQYLVDGKMRPYRETRFYEKNGNKWLRIAPDPQLMGPLQRLDIAHFTIYYQAVDADAVYGAAPRLEKLFAKVSRDVGLPSAAFPSTQSIKVTIGGVQNFSTISSVTPKLNIPSPALLSAPAEMAGGALLYQAMVYPLALRAVYEQTHQHHEQGQSNFLHWFPIQRALPLWEMWQDDGPLAGGREEVVRWLYQNDKEGAPRRTLPEGYNSLCRTYRIWQTVPWYLYIPLTCNELDGTIQSDERYHEYPAHWTLRAQLSSNGATISQNELSSTVMVETLIEYIVASYGEEKLPKFIRALGKYTSLDIVIPALFGVSVAEFEAGWQGYLTEHYDSTGKTLRPAQPF